MPVTRKDRIDFIRENSPEHRDTDFHDYDNSDIFELYLSIPLSADKAKARDKEAGPGFYLWGKLGDWMIRNSHPNWLRVFLLVVWILLNPLCMILYFSFILIIILIYLGQHTW